MKTSHMPHAQAKRRQTSTECSSLGRFQTLVDYLTQRSVYVSDKYVIRLERGPDAFQQS